MKKRISSGSPYEAVIGYSRAVVAGDWCFVSGCTGAESDGRFLPDIARQAENALNVIRQALADAGFDLSDVVRVQYTVTNRGLVDDLAPALAAAFGEIRPAATMVFADLIHPEMLVEIEVTALRG
ncbi:RidA family protein [Haematobacter genomosp. 1]|uniref:RidA family protein n=1 Tax=Haematobacter genomosp. 1 TaxID=366618 RepID=A0A212AA38_9RHOB|nr:RidA family protein [Haematobacter genomosp. 1]OWJ76842.1 hypothetical protein CDV49_13315 [Haematobacter genomosp. 1]